MATRAPALTVRKRMRPVSAREASRRTGALELQVLVAGGNPAAAQAALAWRRVSTA